MSSPNISPLPGRPRFGHGKALHQSPIRSPHGGARGDFKAPKSYIREESAESLGADDDDDDVAEETTARREFFERFKTLGVQRQIAYTSKSDASQLVVVTSEDSFRGGTSSKKKSSLTSPTAANVSSKLKLRVGGETTVAAAAAAAAAAVGTGTDSPHNAGLKKTWSGSSDSPGNSLRKKAPGSGESPGSGSKKKLTVSPGNAAMTKKLSSGQKKNVNLSVVTEGDDGSNAAPLVYSQSPHPMSPNLRAQQHSNGSQSPIPARARKGASMRHSGAARAQSVVVQLSPRSRYMEACMKAGLNPRASLVLKISPQQVHLQHQGMGDKMCKVFAECIEDMPLVESVNLSDNNLTDEGLAPAITAAARSRFLSHLDVSDNVLGPIAAYALLEFLDCDMCPLRRLVMSNCEINDYECQCFVASLMKPHAANAPQLTELNLSKNKLGCSRIVNADNQTTGEAVAQWLGKADCQVKHLNLSWNTIRLESGVSLVNSISSNVSLLSLDLSYNALGRQGGLALGAALLKNKTLKTVRVAHNSLDAVAAFTICVGAMENETLEELTLDGNPIGDKGAMAMMMIPLMRSGKIKVSSKQCNITIKDPDCWFEFGRLPGKYILRMSDPYERAVSLMLLRLVAFHHTCEFSAVEHDATGSCVSPMAPLTGNANGSSGGNSASFTPGKGFSNLGAQNSPNMSQALAISVPANTPLSEITLVPVHVSREHLFDSRLHAIADNMKTMLKCSDDSRAAVALFRKVDLDNSGGIDMHELDALMKSLGIRLTEYRLREIMADFDAGGMGFISLSDFLKYLKHNKQELEKHLIDLLTVPVFVREDDFLAATNNPMHSSGPFTYTRSNSFRKMPIFLPPTSGSLIMEVVDKHVAKDIFRTIASCDQEHIHAIAALSPDPEGLEQECLKLLKMRVDDAVSICKGMAKNHKGATDTLVALLRQMTTAEEARQLLWQVVGDNRTELNKLKREMGHSLKPILGMLNGYYVLDMSNEMDRKTVMCLVELSETLNHKEAIQGPLGVGLTGDTSQKGNWSSFRNELFNGLPFVLDDNFVQSLPVQGKLEFDFSGEERHNDTQVVVLTDNGIVHLLQKLLLLTDEEIPRTLDDLNKARELCNNCLKGDGHTIFERSIEDAVEVNNFIALFYENLGYRSDLLAKAVKREDVKSVSSTTNVDAAAISAVGVAGVSATTNATPAPKSATKRRTTVIPPLPTSATKKSESPAKSSRSQATPPRATSSASKRRGKKASNSPSPAKSKGVWSTSPKGSDVAPVGTTSDEPVLADLPPLSAIPKVYGAASPRSDASSVGSGSSSTIFSAKGPGSVAMDDDSSCCSNSTTDSHNMLERASTLSLSSVGSRSEESAASGNSQVGPSPRMETLYEITTPKGTDFYGVTKEVASDAVTQYLKSVSSNEKLSSEAKMKRLVDALEDCLGCYKYIRARHMALILQCIARLPYGMVDKSKYFGNYRVEVVVNLFGHLVDPHNFDLVLRELNPYETACVTCRVGWLNFFNPIRPEGSYSLDLTKWDQRQIAKALVVLETHEPGENWSSKQFRWTLDSAPVPGWILTQGWTTREGMPDRGILDVTYYSGECMNKKGCAPLPNFRKGLLHLTGLKEKDLVMEDFEDGHNRRSSLGNSGGSAGSGGSGGGDAVGASADEDDNDKFGGVTITAKANPAANVGVNAMKAEVDMWRNYLCGSPPDTARDGAGTGGPGPQPVTAPRRSKQRIGGTSKECPSPASIPVFNGLQSMQRAEESFAVIPVNCSVDAGKMLQQLQTPRSARGRDGPSSISPPRSTNSRSGSRSPQRGDKPQRQQSIRPSVPNLAPLLAGFRPSADGFGTPPPLVSSNSVKHSMASGSTLSPGMLTSASTGSFHRESSSLGALKKAGSRRGSGNNIEYDSRNEPARKVPVSAHDDAHNDPSDYVPPGSAIFVPHNFSNTPKSITPLHRKSTGSS